MNQHQNLHLKVDRTVFKNLEFVLKATGWKETSKIKERISKVLDKVGMGNKGFKFPHELSGGEQQRVAVARALINQPKIIFADEPSGNLDSESAEQLHNLFFKLRDEFKQTFIIVTHNQDLANMADRKLTMVDGKILE